jgi:hypothetical protein
MAEFLLRPPFLFGKWRASHGAGRNAARDGVTQTDAEMTAARDLLDAIGRAIGAGQRLTDSLRDSVENEPLANAASICRWELMVLRERIMEINGPTSLRAAQAESVRYADGAAAAAHMLGNGYRFHNLDRICQGGEALSTQLDGLDRIRARLDGRLTAGGAPASAPVRAS